MIRTCKIRMGDGSYRAPGARYTLFGTQRHFWDVWFLRLFTRGKLEFQQLDCKHILLLDPGKAGWFGGRLTFNPACVPGTGREMQFCFGVEGPGSSRASETNSLFVSAHVGTVGGKKTHLWIQHPLRQAELAKKQKERHHLHQS